MAACRMALLAGRALSSGQCSVYAGIWCLEKAGYFYDRLCGHTVCRVCRVWTLGAAPHPDHCHHHAAQPGNSQLNIGGLVNGHAEEVEML